MRKFGTTHAVATEAVIALIFAGCGVYGISTGNLIIPYMRHDADHELRQLHSLHFQGGHAWLVYAAMMLVAIGCCLMSLEHVKAGPGKRMKANFAVSVLAIGFFVILVMAELRVWGVI
jgi:hypothetical protein